MEIETRFNIGDEVWTISHEQTAVNRRVIGYAINVGSEIGHGDSMSPAKPIVKYVIDKTFATFAFAKSGDELFESRESLIASL